VIKTIAVIPARNEEKYLPKTLVSLKNQTLPLNEIIVVNDGSLDKTAEIARKHECTIIDLPYHERNFVGRPELAERFNAGFQLAKERTPDYILVIGADTILPPEYVEKIVMELEKNNKLIMASGRIKGEVHTESAPRGSGRIIDVPFWEKVNNVKYPVSYGFEGWLGYKAMQLGFEIKAFYNIIFSTQRSTGKKTEEMQYWGRGMYAMGVDWKYAIFRSLTYFFRSPKLGVYLFWGWIRHKDVERLEIADWVNQMQKKRFWKKVWSKIRALGIALSEPYPE